MISQTASFLFAFTQIIHVLSWIIIILLWKWAFRWRVSTSEAGTTTRDCSGRFRFNFVWTSWYLFGIVTDKKFTEKISARKVVTDNPSLRRKNLPKTFSEKSGYQEPFLTEKKFTEKKFTEKSGYQEPFFTEKKFTKIFLARKA